jgi:integrase
MNTSPTIDHARTGSKANYKVKLTKDDDVLALARPRDGFREYHDRDVPGLVVRVPASGKRTYWIKKRAPGVKAKAGLPSVPGKVYRYSIGDVGVMSLADARTDARNALNKIGRGHDPRRSEVGVVTLGEAYELMLGNNRDIRPATKRGYKGLWKRHLKAHAGLRMDAIDSAWVLECRNAAVSEWRKDDPDKPAIGGHEANRLRSLLGVIFSSWITLNSGVGHNPVRAVKKFKCERPRKNKLTVKQAELYLSACERYANGEGRRADTRGTRKDRPDVATSVKNRLRRTTADFLMLTLYMGLRRSNGLGLRWEWINWEQRAVVIPASEHKTGNTNSPVDLKVNIPAPALAILKRRYEDADRHPTFVFPERRVRPSKRNPEPPGAMRYPGKAHKAVLSLAGLPLSSVTIHDLRRTLGSAMIEQGADISEVREQLGHANVSTTSIYLNLDDSPKLKQSLERTAAAFGGAQ